MIKANSNEEATYKPSKDHFYHNGFHYNINEFNPIELDGNSRMVKFKEYQHNNLKWTFDWIDVYIDNENTVKRFQGTTTPTFIHCLAVEFFVRDLLAKSN